ncbi:hypothetical protein B0T14DRAFT_309967 [Immersiella caudata]|uniref:Protein kinase domain-containing protein n=1 Tax=Immersiella caudata TaxID=314043 RepID=A0AA39WFQ2_9PEZI|nr:hypothetical protein B0T14DRAFT_309967 [Immersiella caudata]
MTNLDAQDMALADRILGVLKRSQFDKDNKSFVPEGCLKCIITEKAIAEELQEAYEEADDTEADFMDLVSFIHQEATKPFAIAVCINIEDSTLYRAMKLFKKYNFTDENLPIKQWSDKEKHQFSSFHKLWNRNKISLFYKHQWEFLAPVLLAATQRQSNHDFTHDHVMPFIEKYNEGFDKGSFGQVYQYKIHPSHLRDPDNPEKVWNELVAVKEVQPRSDEDRQKMVRCWEQEASVLQKMNALNQPHIVQFITAFRRGDKGKEDYYLMFEWASGGNLRNLWRTFDRPYPTPALVKDSVRQLLGLATALCEAHYPESGTKTIFRHGDLKPENILWFKGGDGEIGILKIADWGLARQHNLETEQRSNRTSTGSGTRRYEPPEEETGEGVWASSLTPGQVDLKQKKRSRLYDVWAMGCITLEFLIWLLYGPEELKKFNSDINGGYSDYPPFYQIEIVKGKKVARVHDAVVRWMDHMAQDPACAPGETALGSILELVRDRLLVVKLPPRLGTSTYNQPQAPRSSSRFRRIRSNSSLASSIHTPSITPSLSATTSDLDTDAIPHIVISGPDQTDSLAFKPPPISPPRAPPPPVSLSEKNPPLPFSEQGQGGGRALSDEFVLKMEDIFLDHDEEGEDYWLPDISVRRAPPSDDTKVFATDDGDRDIDSNPTIKAADQPKRQLALSPIPVQSGLTAPTAQLADYGNARLADDWEILVDNEFAARLFSNIKASKGFDDSPGLRPTSNLCDDCRELRGQLWDTFDKTYLTSYLRQNAKNKTCDLCGLFYRLCERSNSAQNPTALFERTESSLRLNGTSSSILSIFRDSDLRTRIDHSIQIGFGQLPDADSKTHLDIIRQWLECCDQKHQHLSCTSPTTKRLPTRVLDVGNPGDPKVYLRQTKRGDTGQWLALSHQWGSDPHFCTTTKTLTNYLQGIDFAALPATFRDAVKVCRALGCRYLWIDSLCIIQGPGGDFNQEAKHMEQVYSGAYCVLAVSRTASHHYAGFLHPRKQRDVVALSHSDESPPFYICENIDDFNAHVLEGDLNRRGWVLQEHALARRTVFFTEHQTYWECGGGVRCETMMSMRNGLAAFLGDPSFPRLIETAQQGEKIIHYQNLYERYARLGLTNEYDRPMAIDGLQHRILGALKSQGGFGVFDEGTTKKGLLRRSLLWHRARETTKLKRIVFPKDRTISVVPSWSWMAYTGAIAYVRLEFGGVEWEELQSPWSGGGEVLTEVQGGRIALVGQGREFNVGWGEGEAMLVWDVLGETERLNVLCVVLGRQRGVVKVEARCYVLLVTLGGGMSRDGTRLYERVGAGYLPGRCVHWERSVKVTIH